MAKKKNTKGGGYDPELVKKREEAAAKKAEEQQAAAAAYENLSKEDLKVLKKEEKEKAKEKAAKGKSDKKDKGERRSFIKGCREIGSELKKVQWPTFGRTVKQTGVVLAVVVLFGLVVFAIDRGLLFLYNLLIPSS